MKKQMNNMKDTIGKTIENFAFINNSEGQDLLFLSFTDDTFLCIKPEEDYDNCLTINIGDPINVIGFYNEDLIKLGIITVNEIEDYRNKEIKRKENLEKQLYERLKKKFEKQ